MSKYFFIFLAALSVSACHTSASPTYTATGDNGFRLSCGGFFGDGDLGSCYEKAGQICGESGYRVQQSGVSSMIIACREPESAQQEMAIQK